MANIQLLQRTNKPKKDGTFPIVFKIYLGTRSKIITLPFSCKKEDWDTKNKRLKSKYPSYKEINEALRTHEMKLQSAIDRLEAIGDDYSLDDIKNTYISGLNKNKVKKVTVSDFMLKRITRLDEEKKFGYAKALKDTYNSLFKFADKNITFKQITPAFLDDYEHFLRKTYTEGGIAFRMRDVRRTYNLAIRNEYAKESDYPFKKYKISKLKGKSNKIAITKSEFIQFKAFDINSHKECTNTYKMFLFSYYSGGMNFKDMAYLRWANIQDDRLIYKRDKTQKNFNLKLHQEAVKILIFFKENPQSENTEFVFPIIHKYGLTDSQINGRYKRELRKFNKQLKFIGETVGIDKNLTSYVARHSFATHLKHNGVSETVISELMGHSNVSVTKNYLQDFGSDILDGAMNQLN